MKKELILTLASFAALVAVSCVKEDNTPSETPEGGKLITISATIPVEDLTKVAFEEQGGYAGALKLSWELGDQITVTDATNPSNKSVFTLEASDAGKTEGAFTGTELAPASSYIITYDGAGSTFNYAEQTQATDGSTDHLKYVATLTGVNTYSDITFSEAWATAKGGSFACSSVFRLRVDIPFDLADVQAVYIKSDAPIFAGGKEIKVNITTPADAGETDILTVYASLPVGDQAIAAGTGLIVQFQVSDKPYDKYTAYRTLGAKTLYSGQVNSIALDCNTDQDITMYANKSADEIGTAANPYIIGDQNQMRKIRDNLVKGETTYIKLVDDIDMTGFDWEPLNYNDEFKKYVNFDGQNHTIANLTVSGDYNYPSLFGVLYGTCKNLILDNADVTVYAGKNYKSGILAGYAGTADALTTCVVQNVTVKNSAIKSTDTNSRTMGALVGQVPMAATFTNCHVVNTTVTQKGTATCHAGGFVGYAQGEAIFTDCDTDADVTGNEFAGGFAGYIGKGTFTRCYSSGDVSGTKHVAGFVGKTEVATFEACGYSDSKVTATDNTKNAQSAGFVGNAAATGSTFTNCYAKDCVIVAESGQRIGGFVGQADSGNSFSGCYAKNVNITGALNTGGFVGVDYTKTNGGINKCYVEGGTLTAKGNNIGGFAGYPENATITNSYSTMTINGGTYSLVGGFVGNCRGGNTITSCFESGTITGTGTTVGAFFGSVTVVPTSIDKCIAWNNALNFAGGGEDASAVITNCYIGTSGTISSQATTLGWDTSIWDLSGSIPVLK